MTDLKTVQALPVVELLVQALEMGCPEDPHSIESQAIEAGKALIAQMQRDAVQPAVPEGYKLVMVPELQPQDEPDWDECIRQAEVSTGLRVERHTLSIVIREVRRWLAGRQAEAQALDSQLQQPDADSTRASGVCASTTLLPCPFCGGEASPDGEGFIVVIRCGGCRASMMCVADDAYDGLEESSARLRDVWNRRSAAGDQPSNGHGPESAGTQSDTERDAARYCNKCGYLGSEIHHKRPDGSPCPYVSSAAMGNQSAGKESND